MKAIITYSVEDIQRLISRDILRKFQQQIQPKEIRVQVFTLNGIQTIDAVVDLSQVVREKSL